MKIPLRTRLSVHWGARKAWLFEEDKEYRQVAVAAWVIAFLLIGFGGFLFASFGLHPFSVVAWTLLWAAMVIFAATAVSILAKQEM